MLSFFSAGYEYLAVYPDTEPDMTVHLTLSSMEGAVTKKVRRRGCIIFPLAENMDYTLSAENGTVSLAYLYSEKNMENGVFFLDSGEGANKLPIFSVSMAAFFEGYYHLFYLSSPFGKADENRYLCHAKSRDMLSWTYLPIVLEPPGELCLVRHRTGGVFGGCAVFADGKARLYFTRKIADKRTGETLFSYQSTMESRDLLHFSPEETVIKDAPPKALDLSTPFVFSENGIKYMALGGTLGEKGALFLYKETENGWEYLAPLYKSKVTKRIENPLFIKLGRTFVSLCTLEGFTDSDGTKSPAYLFAGSFKEEKFKLRSRKRLDFGGDFYAPRTFSDGKRILLFGTSGQKGGCLLMREITRKKGRVYIKPITEMYSLLGETIYAGKGAAEISASAFYVKLSFCGKTPFRLTLGMRGEDTLSFTGDGETCGFLLEGAEGARFYDAAMVPKEIEIFADAETVAVFVNGGKAMGTKRFLRTETVFKAEFSDETQVQSFAIRGFLPPQNRFS